MKQCYFILLILINVHHISPLSPIKIWNPWNLRFQAFTTQNHDILETEKTHPPPMQQLILREKFGTNHGWSFCLRLLLTENLLHRANFLSVVSLYLKILFHMSPNLSNLLVLSPWNVTEYVLISISTFSNIRRGLNCNSITYNILCLREGYLTFLNFSFFIGKMGTVLFAVVTHWEMEMQLCANSIFSGPENVPLKCCFLLFLSFSGLSLCHSFDTQVY